MATPANPVVSEPTSSEVLSKLTPEQNKTWRATGELPKAEPAEVKDSKTDAASSPAAKETPAAPAKAAETSADSGTAKRESERPVANAETRIKDLLAKVKELEAQRDNDRRAASSAPAKSEEPRKPHRDDTDAKTGLLVYADDRGIFSEDKFQDALIEYGIERGSYKTRQDLAKQAQERLQAEIQQLTTAEMQTELEETEKRHTDFRDVLQAKTDDKGRASFENPEIKKLIGNGALDIRIGESPIGWEILYYLCKHPGTVEHIQSQRTQKSFGKAFRELERAVEKSLEGSAAAPSKKDEPEPAGSQTPPKVSGAPAPAASVSGKATAPLNEEQAALEAEDFKRYQKEANSREWSAKKAK